MLKFPTLLVVFGMSNALAKYVMTGETVYSSPENFDHFLAVLLAFAGGWFISRMSEAIET